MNFLSDGGEMGQLIREHDWSNHPLGPPEHWPSALKTTLRLLLNTGHPMYIWWGQELFCFYNDAYSQTIGPELHPSSLGRPGREVWSTEPVTRGAWSMSACAGDASSRLAI